MQIDLHAIYKLLNCISLFLSSDREASVMLANSWLYHYYSVQSKIQFGIPFEGPPRVPPTAPFYHHHSPTIQPGLSHPYPPHVSYGYHSPVGVPSQGSPSLVNHHNGSSGQSIGHHNPGMAGDHYRPYSYRLESQPVDYSQQNPIEIRCSSANSSSSSSNNNNNNRVGSPPSKRRAINRLEPLYIPENDDSPESTIMELSSSHHMGESHGQTVLLTTVIPRSRIITKAPPADPPDFMEQWNPSPPWSETAQKVPDMSHQELSPYLTTTPPTPTSAPHGPGAFSFDWMPEQFVPIMDCSPCLPCLTQDGMAVPMSVSVPLQMPHWPSDHRLLPLQSIDRRSDDENGNTVFFLIFFLILLNK